MALDPIQQKILIEFERQKANGQDPILKALKGSAESVAALALVRSGHVRLALGTPNNGAAKNTKLTFVPMESTRPATWEEKIRTALVASGQSDAHVADQTQLGRSKLTKFRDGRKQLTLADSQRLAEYLGFELVAKDGSPGARPQSELENRTSFQNDDNDLGY